jgi:hypothetical protein
MSTISICFILDLFAVLWRNYGSYRECAPGFDGKIDSIASSQPLQNLLACVSDRSDE